MTSLQQCAATRCASATAHAVCARCILADARLFVCLQAIVYQCLPDGGLQVVQIYADDDVSKPSNHRQLALTAQT